MYLKSVKNKVLLNISENDKIQGDWEVLHNFWY